MFRNMLCSIGFAFILLIAFPSIGWGAESAGAANDYERFWSATDALYDAVNVEKLEDAASRLMEVEKQFRGLPMEKIASAEGIHALALSITEMKRAVAAVQPNLERWKTGAAVLKLAADALAHPDQPIWHQYEAIINDDLLLLGETIAQSSVKSGPVVEPVRTAFIRLSDHYMLIRTAVSVSVEPWKVERSDSSIRYASRILKAESPTHALVEGVVAPLKEALGGLFPEHKDTEAALVPPVAAAPTWGLSAMIGSFIVAVLTWVGWQRYKVDQISSIPRGSLPRPHRTHRR